MKILKVKTAIAAVCVVAAGFGGVKAYNSANQLEADLLLAENLEALTAGENNNKSDCDYYRGESCYVNENGNIKVYDNQRQK